jgi:cadmium resistance protein CadD (predicted permease)
MVVSRPWLGLLGLVPIALGIKSFLDRDDDGAAAAAPMKPGNTILTVASITIANGGDNLGVYTPLFATLSVQGIAVTGIVFAVLIALWCELARQLVQHPQWGDTIRRYSARLLPFVFIVLGVWIIIEMDTPQLLSNPR